MRSATILCFLAAVLSVSALPINDLSTHGLSGRGMKIGPPRPEESTTTKSAVPKSAVPKSAAPKPTVAPKPKPKPSVCNGISSCLACTKNKKCTFNSSTLKCAVWTRTASFVTDPKLCPPLKQAAGIAPTPKVAQEAAKKFAAMKQHLFIGEENNPTSGRHTFNAWTSANKGPWRCDPVSKLCVFRLDKDTPKTVFDDRPGAFTEADVKQMCTTAITLNLQGGALQDGAFVVQTKFGKPICVRHQIAGDGSCFPLGIHAAGLKLNSPCESTGNGEVKGYENRCQELVNGSVRPCGE